MTSFPGKSSLALVSAYEGSSHIILSSGVDISMKRAVEDFLTEVKVD